MSRERPSDFWTTYVEIGRDATCEYYRCHKTLVMQWVRECPGIKEARAEYLASLKPKRKPKPKPVRIEDHDSDDLHAACAWFREPRNGGWVCGVRPDGLAYRGSRVMQPVEFIALALAKGMDEWYVEADIMKRLAQHEGVDEWVLGNV